MDILFQCHLKNTNYLGITLNLNDDSYHPYRKPTHETNYIHTNSNHPLSINKDFQDQLKKTLNIVIIKKKFEESVICYKKTKLQYQQPKDSNQTKKKRKRNIIWFDPPQQIC